HVTRLALVTREKERLEATVAVRTAELREAGARLARKNEQLVRLDEERGELMDVVAHDLKNPLGVVVGYMTLVTEKDFPKTAVKVSPAGGALRVSPAAAGAAFRAPIEDSGPGVTAEDQKRLFRKFARLSARPTAGEHSSGVGLALVQSLVTRMEGRVWCESEP